MTDRTKSRMTDGPGGHADRECESRSTRCRLSCRPTSERQTQARRSRLPIALRLMGAQECPQCRGTDTRAWRSAPTRQKCVSSLPPTAEAFEISWRLRRCGASCLRANPRYSQSRSPCARRRHRAGRGGDSRQCRSTVSVNGVGHREAGVRGPSESPVSAVRAAAWARSMSSAERTKNTTVAQNSALRIRRRFTSSS